MLTTTNMTRDAMRKARAAHRSRKTAYSDARRQGRCVPFGLAIPSWADDSHDTVANYIANQFAPMSLIEE